VYRAAKNDLPLRSNCCKKRSAESLQGLSDSESKEKKQSVDDSADGIRASSTAPIGAVLVKLEEDNAVIAAQDPEVVAPVVAPES
jgi:hypothetical protein